MLNSSRVAFCIGITSVRKCWIENKFWVGNNELYFSVPKVVFVDRKWINWKKTDLYWSYLKLRHICWAIRKLWSYFQIIANRWSKNNLVIFAKTSSWRMGTWKSIKKSRKRFIRNKINTTDYLIRIVYQWITFLFAWKFDFWIFLGSCRRGSTKKQTFNKIEQRKRLTKVIFWSYDDVRQLDSPTGSNWLFFGTFSRNLISAFGQSSCESRTSLPKSNFNSSS